MKIEDFRLTIEKIKEAGARFDGYLAGCRHGKTMAEVDAHYEELLKEIKEMQEQLIADSSKVKYERN